MSYFDTSSILWIWLRSIELITTEYENKALHFRLILARILMEPLVKEDDHDGADWGLYRK
jgi:hypothetical protein